MGLYRINREMYDKITDFVMANTLSLKEGEVFSDGGIIQNVVVDNEKDIVVEFGKVSSSTAQALIEYAMKTGEDVTETLDLSTVSIFPELAKSGKYKTFAEVMDAGLVQISANRGRN